MLLEQIKNAKSVKELSELVPNRADLTYKEQVAFVEKSYELHEKEGFSKVFKPRDPSKKWFDGQPIEVLDRISFSEGFGIEVLPMWNVRFPDGYVFAAYPEEITA